MGQNFLTRYPIPNALWIQDQRGVSAEEILAYSDKKKEMYWKSKNCCSLFLIDVSTDHLGIFKDIWFIMELYFGYLFCCSVLLDLSAVGSVPRK